MNDRKQNNKSMRLVDLLAVCQINSLINLHPNWKFVGPYMQFDHCKMLHKESKLLACSQHTAAACLWWCNADALWLIYAFFQLRIKQSTNFFPSAFQPHKSNYRTVFQSLPMHAYICLFSYPALYTAAYTHTHPPWQGNKVKWRNECSNES